MKKYLLLLLTMLTTTLGAWAEEVTFGDGNSTYEVESDGSYTITVKKVTDLSAPGWDKWPWKNATKINLKLDGITMQSLCGVDQLYNLTQDTSVTTIDITELNTTDLDYLKNNWNSVPSNFKDHFNNLTVPSSYASDFVTTTGKNVFAASDLTLTAYITNVNNVNWSDVKGSCTTLSLYNFSSGDLGSCGFSTIDFTNTTLTGTTTVPTGAIVYVNTTAEKAHIEGTDATNVKVPFLGTATVAAGGSLESNITTLLNSYDLHNTLADITTLTVTGELTSADVTWLSTNKNNLTGLMTLDLTGATFGAGVTKASVAEAVRTGVTVQYPASYIITDGCKVTIDMSKLLGEDFATVLAQAKAALGSTNICTLIVTGPVTNNDLAILGDAVMTGASRIDLSGATLATGASIDNLQLPSSLTSLILPKNQTVSSVLAGKLEAAGNVNYAYSPSSDAQRLGASSTGSYDGTKNKIADYVWVVKAGGLAQAFTNEEWLRNSFYIKVASSVELNQADVDFNALGTNKPTNYLFLDFSGSNLTPEMAANYRVTDQIGYRIILPDNWTNAQMAVFANMGTQERGSLAAVYSYEGSKLNILVIDNASYNGTALKNPRIVRSGTDAIEILPGTYEGNHPFGPYSADNDNDGVTDGIISAINNAQASIKSVIINIGNTADNSNGGPYNFTNPNMTYLSLEGIKSYYNPAQGPNITISNASSLQTLNLKNASLWTVTATGLTSLETVDMTGTIVVNATDLSSNSRLNTLTTNSSTEFKGTLNLASTGLTSFASPAKVTGDIYLNATPLTSLDLTTTQFQNTDSKIHIHATNDENDNNPIATLNSDGNKTISVTNKFNGENNVSPRIHPFTNIADNISEAAASGDATLSGCTDCKITYDATKGVATVHAVHPGHFAELMKTLYAGYPQGTTFKFDKDCKQLNLDDLKSLCGKNIDNDMTWRSNYYYVDLYDVPATSDLCKSATFENNEKIAEGGLIYQWIEWMRENDRQVKGLILPKDHTQYGSGTTLIQDGAGTNKQLATCSEFIAYYKTKDEEGNSLTQQTFVGHVYNQTPTNADAYQASYEKMLSLVDAHTYRSGEDEVPEVKTDADIVLITSNSATKVNSSSTSISGATRIETINNEMVGTQAGKGSIYAYPNAPGDFATACASTNLKSTPTELLQINGAISDNDITAINGFTNGPRVLDLRYANTSGQTGMITKAMLEALTNTHIEYILLPEGQTKAVVCGSDYSDLNSLKAVISSTSTNCVAYVKTAGSLAEARYLATGGSIVDGTSLFSPAKLGLTSVTLTGTLNAADIGCNLTTYHTDAYGHWKNTSGDDASVGLSGETGITSIDLADAVFVNKATNKETDPVTYADMNLSWAGLANLSDIKLPTSKEMKDIPESCCEGLASLKEICIPSNYEKIHNAAFLNTIVEHITTTDALGTLVDNGPNTYTLSANLKQVGDEPADNTVGLTATQTVFPQNRPVFDCYVLATMTPICYKNAFPANMLYGWGGFDGTLPYCRDKYVNGTNYYCVLRFPSQESYNATAEDKRDTSYGLMKQQYTDVTKVYSKMEQTGAVDANGDAITWPTFSELRRAYNQATAGITWNRWVANYDGQQEVNGGDNIPTEATGLTLGHYKSTDGTANNDLGDYTFDNYEGWHQFTLSQATYVEPDEVAPETREYEDAGWFTFCIPYDMTMKQVREWLGVPKSEGNVHCYYNNAEVTTPMMPDVRMLASVTRHTSTGAGNNNKVTFRLSTNLVSAEAGNYLNFDRTAAAGSRWNTANAAGQASYDSDSKPCLVGGIPYIIKAYKRKGEKIKSYNLGQYIMTRYGDQFKLTQACLNRGVKYYEYLGTTGGNLATLKFSKPYEEAIVVAVNDAPSGGYCTYMDGDNTRDYEYALVGTFWDQKLPRYCFYQSKGKWYRNTNVNDYKWSAYKCVIMAVPYKAATSYSGYDGHNGQYYRENPSALGMLEENKSFYPSIEANTTDKLNGTLKIVFADGRDDDDFSAAAARYSFAFDDDIVEYDDMGNEATAIDKLDCEDITPLPNNYKVYNMSGQYVGNSVNGLAKGMYVVNGKKYVIK